MADDGPDTNPPADSPEAREQDKRLEFRELRGRIKEIREVIQVLGARRKELEARQAELAAELGQAKPKV